MANIKIKTQFVLNGLNCTDQKIFSFETLIAEKMQKNLSFKIYFLTKLCLRVNDLFPYQGQALQ